MHRHGLCNAFGVTNGEWTTIPRVRCATLGCVVQPLRGTDDRLVSLVTLMLDLHARQATAKTPQEKTALARQIAASDRQIDALVYELYGLTEEEIRIVEVATK